VEATAQVLCYECANLRKRSFALVSADANKKKHTKLSLRQKTHIAYSFCGVMHLRFESLIDHSRVFPFRIGEQEPKTTKLHVEIRGVLNLDKHIRVVRAFFLVAKTDQCIPKFANTFTSGGRYG